MPAGTFGPHGGRHVAETLVPALTRAMDTIASSASRRAELGALLARRAARRGQSLEVQR